MFRSMFRILTTLMVTTSLAVTGMAMASPDHHNHMTIKHSDHDLQRVQHQGDTCHNDDCEPSFVMMFCNMTADSCSFVGVPAGTDATTSIDALGLGEFLITKKMFYIGQPFEAEPRPPRT
jgi:hypothetical protein